EALWLCVQYGVDRTTHPVALAQHDAIWTTYGVLSGACKSDVGDSIFHQVDWYRVILDEAHTIKPSRTQVAQAAFSLSSYCRWCQLVHLFRIIWKIYTVFYASCMLNHGVTGRDKCIPYASLLKADLLL
ncbi:hypothetical protein MKW94_029634, partial [Papaver nudicaule]|nr:hypothetical protein [Papaver nudicaule]